MKILFLYFFTFLFAFYFGFDSIKLLSKKANDCFLVEFDSNDFDDKESEDNSQNELTDDFLILSSTKNNFTNHINLVLSSCLSHLYQIKLIQSEFKSLIDFPPEF